MLTRNYAIGYAAKMTKEFSEKFDYGSIINYKGNAISFSEYGQYSTTYADLFTYYQNPPVSKVAAGGSGPQGFVFGDGDKPESVNDFKMAGNHFTTFNHTLSKTITLEEGYIVANYLFTITNTGNEAFTIREIGQFNYPGSAHNLSALLERTVLKSPVTIPASGIGQVTYTVRFPIPSL